MLPIEQRIEGVVDTVLADYKNGRQIDRMQTLRRPDTDTVVDIIGKLRRIVFPGYFREKNYRLYNARHNLSVLIEDVMFNLSREISLVYQSQGMPEQEAQSLAEEMTLQFLGKIPQVRELVQLDVEAFYEGDPAATGVEEIIFAYPGMFAVTVYRLAHELYLLNVPMIPRIMTEHAHSVTGIDIHPGATIGKYFFIDHGTGIVVGETTVIGDRVKLYQGVTLGALSTRGGQSLRGKRRHPTIGDCVTIYAGASVLGGDTVIGKDCVIGSNVFITTSIPDCTTVTVKNQELQLKSRDCSVKELGSVFACGGDCATCEKHGKTQ